MNSRGINKIFDVGANIGQFAKKTRYHRFIGTIISFEPLPDAFRKLQSAAKPDKLWTTGHMAVGNMDGEIEINIACYVKGVRT